VVGHQLAHPDGEAATPGLANPQGEGLKQASDLVRGRLTLRDQLGAPSVGSGRPGCPCPDVRIQRAAAGAAVKEGRGPREVARNVLEGRSGRCHTWPKGGEAIALTPTNGSTIRWRRSSIVPACASYGCAARQKLRRWKTVGLSTETLRSASMGSMQAKSRRAGSCWPDRKSPR
jgi:hypothetical protein